MARIELKFQVQREGAEMKVRRYRLEADGVYHKLPTELQSETLHERLFTYPPIIRARRDCSEEKNFRHQKVKMTEADAALYLDDSGNLVFSDTSLEPDENQTEKVKKEEADECQKEANGAAGASERDQYWIKRLDSVERELRENKKLNIVDVEKKFLLNKYDGEEDANTWFAKFESECERYKIDNREKRIEALGKVLKPGSRAATWHDVSVKKLETCQWATWKSAFLKVFAPKNWDAVVEAIDYRYSEGPLTAYSLMKEKKLLLTDPAITQRSMINLIVHGLPKSIQEKLERKDYLFVNDLHEKLNALADPPPKYRVPGGKDHWKGGKRKPCAYCDSKGLRGRFHREEDCRTKQWDEKKPKDNRKDEKKPKTKAQANLMMKESSDDSSSESSSEDERSSGQKHLNE